MAVNYGNFLGNVGANADLAGTTGTPTADIATIAGKAVNAGLGILGVVLLGYTLYAGYLWMTAQGEEEKVQKAQGIIKTSIIGLIITLSAYAIASFVVTQITTATGTSSTTPTTTAP